MSKRNLLPQPDTKYHHLSKYGYKLSSKKELRHNSLKKASKRYGTLPVLKRVNLIRNITNPQLKKNKNKLASDVKFMTQLYNKEKRNIERQKSKKSSKGNSKRKNSRK
jgi:hypothetical protein